MRSLSKVGLAAFLAVVWIFSSGSLTRAQQATELEHLTREFTELQRAGRYSQAIPVAERILSIHESRSDADQSSIAVWLNNIGRVVPETRSVLRVAQSVNNLAFLYRDQGRHTDAEPLLQRSLTILEKAFGGDHPEVANALCNLGQLYEDQGRYTEARPLLQRALDIREKAFGREHPDIALSLNNLAFLYQDQGRYAEAEPLFQRSLAIREKALGSEHPDIAQSLNNLGFLYRAQARYADAEPLLQRSLAIREKALGRDNPNVAVSLNNLGFLYLDQHRYAEAEPLLQRALTIFESSFGPEHPEVAESLNHLGLLYRDQARYADAESLLQRSLSIVEKTFGRDHPTLALPLNNLALLYQKQGRYAEAETFHKRGLSILENALGQDHPTVAATFDNLASLYVRLGDTEDALTHSRQATASVIAHAAVQTTGAQQAEGATGLVGRRADYFVRHVANLAAAARERLRPQSELGREALGMAQWAKQSTARPPSSKWDCALRAAAIRSPPSCASARTFPLSGATATGRFSQLLQNRKASKISPRSPPCAGASPRLRASSPPI